MPEISELVFAQRFPFSSKALKIVKESNFSLEEVSEQAINRARIMLLNASKGKNYFLPKITTDLMENEVYAFPIAKIFLSLLNREELNRRFSKMLSNSSFTYLESEKNNDSLLELLREFNIDYSLSERKPFLLEVNLLDYLSMHFFEDYMKLVNQKIEKGKIFLNRNDSIRFTSSLVYNKILSSLPLKTEGIPKKFKETAKELANELSYSRRRTDFRVVGRVNPSAFPPCLSDLYSAALDGRKLSHDQRFYLATFLLATGMSSEEVISIYSKTPNFKEKLTRYHIQRIKGRDIKQKYAPASCSKMKQHKLCRKDVSCEGISHPVSYYIRKIKELKKAS